MKRLLMMALLLIISSAGFAYEQSNNPFFKVKVNQQGVNHYKVTWQLAKGVYLYKDSINIKAKHNAKVSKLVLPPGAAPHSDDIYQNRMAYRNQVSALFTLTGVNKKTIPLVIDYQGCSDAGICLPPEQQALSVTATPVQQQAAKSVATNANHYAALFAHGHVVWLILSFFGIGLLLSLTPCVLPMIPILSSIILGQQQRTLKRGLTLSSIYVFSMAVTYAVIGVIAGYIGGSLQTFLQQTWVIALMAALFVVLALWMFGLINLRMPQSLQDKMNSLNGKQKGGSLWGVAIMGVLATLIVSPCVSPPLIGAIAYVGQSGNVALGGFALFAMGLGMGVPLLIIGAGNATLVPKSGVWMNTVKAIAGVLMLAVAWWMLQRIIPSLVATFILGVGIILVCTFIGINPFKRHHQTLLKLRHGIGFIGLIYGCAVMVGALAGNANLLQPLQIAAPAVKTEGLQFKIVKSVAELNVALNKAKQEHMPVMLDFAASWCPDCRYMDSHTFQDLKVISAVKQLVLIRADISKTNDAKVKALMQKFSVIGPPDLFFYNKAGVLQSSLTRVGITEPKQLTPILVSLQ